MEKSGNVWQVAFNPLQSETLRGPYLEALEGLRRSGALSSLKAGDRVLPPADFSEQKVQTCVEG